MEQKGPITVMMKIVDNATRRVREIPHMVEKYLFIKKRSATLKHGEKDLVTAGFNTSGFDLKKFDGYYKLWVGKESISVKARLASRWKTLVNRNINTMGCPLEEPTILHGLGCGFMFGVRTGNRILIFEFFYHTDPNSIAFRQPRIGLLKDFFMDDLCIETMSSKIFWDYYLHFPHSVPGFISQHKSNIIHEKYKKSGLDICLLEVGDGIIHIFIIRKKDECSVGNCFFITDNDFVPHRIDILNTKEDDDGMEISLQINGKMRSNKSSKDIGVKVVLKDKED